MAILHIIQEECHSIFSRKAIFQALFIDVRRITLRLTMYIEGSFPNQCYTTKLINLEKENENYDCEL